MHSVRHHSSHHSEQEILADAKEYCREHNLRFTSGRQEVLKAVVKSKSAIKAYDVLKALTAPGAKAMPPTVYRALDFWIEHGFIHKVESWNGYFACRHPLHAGNCQILVCSHCGHTCEVCGGIPQQRLAEIADEQGFKLNRAVLEIHGLCTNCQGRD